jgi:hypothetical protein
MRRMICIAFAALGLATPNRQWVSSGVDKISVHNVTIGPRGGCRECVPETTSRQSKPDQTSIPLNIMASMLEAFRDEWLRVFPQT